MIESQPERNLIEATATRPAGDHRRRIEDVDNESDLNTLKDSEPEASWSSKGSKKSESAEQKLKETQNSKGAKRVPDPNDDYASVSSTESRGHANNEP